MWSSRRATTPRRETSSQLHWSWRGIGRHSSASSDWRADCRRRSPGPSLVFSCEELAGGAQHSADSSQGASKRTGACSLRHRAGPQAWAAFVYMAIHAAPGMGFPPSLIWSIAVSLPTYANEQDSHASGARTNCACTAPCLALKSSDAIAIASAANAQLMVESRAWLPSELHELAGLTEPLARCCGQSWRERTCRMICVRRSLSLPNREEETANTEVAWRLSKNPTVGPHKRRFRRACRLL